MYLRRPADQERPGGNVRELENVVERTVALCKGRHVTVDDLPPKLLHAADGVEPPPGTFKSVPQLIEAANEYAKNHSRDPIMFDWTRDADTSLGKIERCKGVRPILGDTPALKAGVSVSIQRMAACEAAMPPK